MVFCVVTEGAANENTALPECDAAIFGFSGLGEVNYESELKGESEKFEEAARLSKSADCGLICGCTTLSRGMVRKSAAACDRGRLLGISDMNHVLDGEQFKSGSSLGFYKMGGCKVGLCVENDLFFPETVKSLTMCGCNAIVAIMEEIRDFLPPLIIRSYAYLYGVPIIMCAGKMAYFADITGAIATSAQKITLFEVNPKNKYHLVTTRIKGIFNDAPIDF